MFQETFVTVATFLTTPWVLLILLASVMYAAGNYIDELLLSKYEQEVGTMVIISTLFGLVVALVFAAIIIYSGQSFFLERPIWIQALLVGVLEALWVIPYLYATERSGAIIAGPLFQAVPVFALAMEATYGIFPPMMQIVGALLIVGGGILLSIESEENEEGKTSRSINWGTIGMMSISVILVALIYVLFKDAAVASNFSTVGFWAGIGSLLTGICIYVLWQPYRENFNTFCKHANYKAVGIQFFNEILDSGGAYITNLANTLGPSVFVVTAFNATQPIAIGIIGGSLALLGFSSISTEKKGVGAWLLISASIILIACGTVVIALNS